MKIGPEDLAALDPEIQQMQERDGCAEVIDNWNELPIWWGRRPPRPGDPTAEIEAQVLALADERRLKPHVLAKLALDLVCYAFARNEYPPIKLLRRALNISEKHVIAGWPLYAGVCDERGDANFAMQALAGIVDREYLDKHGAEMSVGELARELEEAWGETIHLRTLRRWRERPCYWDRYRDDEDVDPPAGYLPAEWIIARTIDREYRVEHGEVMPVSELERRLTERGQSVDRATLERWRKVRHYWADPEAEE